VGNQQKIVLRFEAQNDSFVKTVKGSSAETNLKSGSESWKSGSESRKSERRRSNHQKSRKFGEWRKAKRHTPLAGV